MEDQKESTAKNIIERHYKKKENEEGGQFNITAAFLEVDKRLLILEEIMFYLAETEKRKMGIQEKIDGLILPDNRIITGPEI